MGALKARSYETRPQPARRVGTRASILYVHKPFGAQTFLNHLLMGTCVTTQVPKYVYNDFSHLFTV